MSKNIIHYKTSITCLIRNLLFLCESIDSFPSCIWHTSWRIYYYWFFLNLCRISSNYQIFDKPKWELDKIAWDIRVTYNINSMRISSYLQYKITWEFRVKIAWETIEEQSKRNRRTNKNFKEQSFKRNRRTNHEFEE